MPSFLKDLSLRRRSKTSFKTTETTNSSGNTSSNDAGSDEPPTNQSSLTLNSYADKQEKDKTSPPSTLSSFRSRSSGHLAGLTSGRNGTKTPPVEPRPRLPSGQYSSQQRYSLAGGMSGGVDGVPRQTPATSPLAPRVTTISDGSWVSCCALYVKRQQANT